MADQKSNLFRQLISYLEPTAEETLTRLSPDDALAGLFDRTAWDALAAATERDRLREAARNPRTWRSNCDRPSGAAG